MDFIVNASDEEFGRDVDRYLNLEACLNYYCFICIANDSEARNMLMFSWNGETWQPMLYDLDSLWGVLGDGEHVTAEMPGGLLNVGCNRLFQRI